MEHKFKQYLLKNKEQILKNGYIHLMNFLDDYMPQMAVLNQFFKSNGIHLYLEQLNQPHINVSNGVGMWLQNNLEASYGKGSGEEFRKLFGMLDFKNLMESESGDDVKNERMFYLINSYFANAYEEALFSLDATGQQILDILNGNEE